MKYILPVLLVFLSCQKSQTQSQLPPAAIEYADVPSGSPIINASITEASGMVYSKSMKGKLWVHQDSGNPALLYLLNADGSVSDSVRLEGGINRDWEDMSIGAGPDVGKWYLYIGDIGDNDAKYTSCTIYRFEEPASGETNITSFDRINYKYNDGPRDAEAFLVDPQSKDIYIITKREQKSRVYKLPYPQSTTEENIAEYLFELNYSSVVSAALSETGEEVLVKTYTQIHHYTKDVATPLLSTLETTTPKLLAYQLEPQGEAISFDYNTTGFYTLSEEAMGIKPQLYFYKKK